MHLKKRFVLLLSFIFIFSNSISFASTIIHFKNGQMVEGNFLGGTSNAINIEVASQNISINIKEIAYIIFDKKYLTNLNNNSSSVVSDSYNSDATEVLKSLKVIKSITHAGVNYRDYQSKVMDATIKVDEFLDKHKKSNDPNFKKQIYDAIGYYNAASKAWLMNITDDQLSYFELPINEYCKKCKILQEVINSPDNVEYKDGGRSEGILISSMGIRPLWQCADDSIVAAEKALKN